MLKTTLRYIAIGSLFLIPLFPLIIANGILFPNLFFPFITGKAFFFRILVEVGFMSWVILAFLDHKYRPRITPIGLAVTIFTIVVLLADLLGVNPVRSIWSNFERMDGWLTIIHLWMFFMAATGVFGSGVEGKRWWHRWLNMSLGVAVVTGLYGIFQLLGWSDIHQGSTRIDASLGNAIYMAVYMLFHVFISAYLFFARADVSKKIDFPQWIYAVLAIIFSYLLFMTATRGTILGLIGGVLLALAIYAVFGKKEAPRKRIIAAGAIVIVILAGFIFWLNRDAAFVQNSEVLRRLASISIQETTTQARSYIWPMALKGWQERPVLGWGQENFNYIFNANYNPKMWAHEQWFDRAHNVYLDWLTAGGVVGILAYLALYVFCLRSIWKSDLTIRNKSVLTGLVVGYAIHNVFVFDNLASYVMFFATLGFASSLREGKVVKWFGKEGMREDAVEYIVAPIALVLLVLGVYFLNVRPLQAGTRLIDALQACASGKADPELFNKVFALNAPVSTQEAREQLISCANNVILGQYPNPTKQAFFDLAGSESQAHIAAYPNDTRIYAIVGIYMNSIGRFSEAEAMLTQALRLSPGKQSIISPLAIAYANNNKVPEALTLAQQAYDSAPENPNSRLLYGSMLVLSGKEKEARTLFGNDAEIFDSETIAQIYINRGEFTKAAEVFERKVAKNPSDPDTRLMLARIYQAGGMNAKAIKTLQALSKDFPAFKDAIDQAIKELQK
jgi:O-antigen ligase/tetratricopeptide (TPR) repeat protein